MVGIDLLRLNTTSDDQRHFDGDRPAFGRLKQSGEIAVLLKYALDAKLLALHRNGDFELAGWINLSRLSEVFAAYLAFREGRANSIALLGNPPDAEAIRRATWE